MNEPSGLETAARALLGALDGLALALAGVRHDAIQACEGRLERETQAFARAAAEATLAGHELPLEAIASIETAVRRCQGLGAAFLQADGGQSALAAAAYTPQGQMTGPSTDVPLLIARA